jgi:DNA-binding response OmpR family regulator
MGSDDLPLDSGPVPDPAAPAPPRMRYSCLVIEPDGAAASTAMRGLKAYGFKPFRAGSPDAALGLLRQWAFDAALLDADGFGAGHVDVLRRLRPQFGSPVIVLSTPQDERQQILSLESGATEVVAKPASARLLAMKMQRLIEVGRGRAKSDAPIAEALAEAPFDEPLALGPLAMDPRRGLATLDDRPLPLTAHQFDLLFLLASRAGESVDRDTIALRLRGSRDGGGRSTDVQVSRIRRKLREQGAGGLRIATVHGCGYRLLPAAGAPPKPR